jgi:hypothetical protein
VDGADRTEQLLAECARLVAENATLTADNASLSAENVELRSLIDLWVPITHPTRSGRKLVLMNEVPKDLASS